MNPMRCKPDVHSIRFKLWLNFIAFAAVLLILIWVLQLFFLSYFYESMKRDEIGKVARTIQTEFRSDNSNMDDLRKSIRQLCQTSDMTVIIWNRDTWTTEINSDVSDDFDEFHGFNRYTDEILDLYTKLEDSALHSAQTTTRGRMKNRTLGYVCELSGSTLSDSADRYLLFVFSPLFPVGSTINILKIQLLYVTIIAILLALALSLYLSTRISRPIKAITASAAEMGKGNYNVKFQRGHYSEINELADTLTQAETELERTDMYQKDLIANVSHDLRTPLTMIKSYAEMIRDLSGDNPKKRNKHLGVIIDETNRLNQLVNDMLNLSRMQSHKIVLEKSVFDLSTAAASIMTSYNILQDNEGYDIRFSASQEPLLVNGDENKLKQVMINLVNNAVKYCGEDKVILVSLKRTGRKVRFSVTDHGQGIAPEELSHVWERYYKSSTHHVRTTEGSGLGLSIVKEILCLHKAEFDVQSTVGKGSTFWFQLPLEKRKGQPT